MDLCETKLVSNFPGSRVGDRGRVEERLKWQAEMCVWTPW